LNDWHPFSLADENESGGSMLAHNGAGFDDSTHGNPSREADGATWVSAQLEHCLIGERSRREVTS
jgi:hypothetical protein